MHKKEILIDQVELNYSLHLKADRAQSWHTIAAGTYWRGYAFLGDQLVDEERLQAELAKVHSDDSFSSLLSQLNGCFALVHEKDGKLRAGVDIGRTIPLFWRNQDRLELTDQLGRDTIQDTSYSSWKDLDWFARAEFIPGSATIWQDWQQLRAGEWLSWDGRATRINTYYNHLRPTPVSADRDQLEVAFNEVLDGVFDRFIQWADGREIVVLLSGGYDSRLILAALKERNYPKLSAYSYGLAHKQDMRRAQQVAQTLKIPALFCFYAPDVLQNFFGDDWKQYTEYAANGTALPQEQDYFALKLLAHEGRSISKDAVICSGYCGDFQAGSYHPKGYFDHFGRGEDALHDLLRYRFDRRPDAASHALLKDLLPKLPKDDTDSIVSVMEDWVLREYVSKYILNGVRAYEWHGFQWYLPLWDRAFIDFWQRVPNEFRHDQSLYRQSLRYRYFKPMDIHYADEEQLPAPPWWNDWLSIPWKARLKRFKPPRATRDNNGLDWLIPAIQQDLQWPRINRTKSINEMIGWWYLQHLSEDDS